MVTMTYNKSFGTYLAELRVCKGFENQKDLADVSGVSTATISRIESGLQKASINVIRKIAPHLKTSIQEMVERSGYLDETDDLLINELNDEEKDLINRFRKLTPFNKQTVLVLIGQLELQGKEQSAVKEVG
jgi:transcriptional regulator with XRE-family HTH domain